MLRLVRGFVLVLVGSLVSTVALAQLAPGLDGPDWREPHSPPIRLPGGLPTPEGYPSVWEGGTNMMPQTEDVEGRSHARASSGSTRESGNFAHCTGIIAPILVPGGQPGQLTLVDDDCASPLAGHEVWTWPIAQAWPDSFEIAPVESHLSLTGQFRSWAFDRTPFDLHTGGLLLGGVSTLPGDRLYQVERVREGASSVIAWFWFQAGIGWNQVAFEKASLKAEFITLQPGEVLRFRAIDEADLPRDVPVIEAGDW